MKRKEIRCIVLEYDRLEELPEEDRRLLEQARQASAMAYAPYSGFKVGAALLLENGTVITGNNQENAAFPSGLCAERVALFHAAAQYPDIPIRTLAIVATRKGEYTSEPVSPCGSCRQVMIESESRQNKPFRIILGGKDRFLVVDKASDLLPIHFDHRFLK
ncbi:MAG TPA: cytidine deaminase [Bacteroidetes bacterium]|mgnify:CR=1 FL=1|nr:cytidine deaminase [Bacteroidota bacterium]